MSKKSAKAKAEISEKKINWGDGHIGGKFIERGFKSSTHYGSSDNNYFSIFGSNEKPKNSKLILPKMRRGEWSNLGDQNPVKLTRF